MLVIISSGEAVRVVAWTCPSGYEPDELPDRSTAKGYVGRLFPMP